MFRNTNYPAKELNSCGLEYVNANFKHINVKIPQTDSRKIDHRCLTTDYIILLFGIILTQYGGLGYKGGQI